MHKYLPTKRHGSYFTSMQRQGCTHFPFKQTKNFNPKFIQLANKQIFKCFQTEKHTLIQKNCWSSFTQSSGHAVKSSYLHKNIRINITSKYSNEFTNIMYIHDSLYLYMQKIVHFYIYTYSLHKYTHTQGICAYINTMHIVFCQTFKKN